MRWYHALAVMAAVLVAHAAPALAEKRVALVIGNADYGTMSSLRNPANDARDMAAALTGLGFELVDGRAQVNLRRAEMIRRIDEFAASLGPGDVGLFFFAGHGAQFDGGNFLIPVDDREIQFREDLPDWAVGAETIRRKLEGRDDVTAILILDACRNTPLPSRVAGRTASRGLARMEELPGSFIAFATAPGQEASDGAGRNGLFTSALLDALKRPDRSIDDLFIDVRGEVSRKARALNRAQQPWTASSLKRQFYFKTPVALRPAGFDADAQACDLARSTDRPGVLEAYLAEFPAGKCAPYVRIRLASLRVPKPPAPPRKAPEEAQPGSAAGVAPSGVSTGPAPVPPGAHPVAMPEPPRREDIPSPSPLSGTRWTEPYSGIEFVWVPGGSFEMGCGSWAGECEDHEKPVHREEISGFWLGVTEVTQAQWQRVMGKNPSFFKDPDRPVDSVSWDDAQTFIKRLNQRGNGIFRLPHEAEWEYACRSGGKEERYCGGNQPDKLAWGSENSGGETHPVKGKRANGLGLYDMSGNMLEWVEDCYKQFWNRPAIPAITCEGRPLRGGMWDSKLNNSRSVSRSWGIPNQSLRWFGFRVAR